MGLGILEVFSNLNDSVILRKKGSQAIMLALQYRGEAEERGSNCPSSHPILPPSTFLSSKHQPNQLERIGEGCRRKTVGKNSNLIGMLVRMNSQKCLLSLRMLEPFYAVLLLLLQDNSGQTLPRRGERSWCSNQRCVACCVSSRNKQLVPQSQGY